MKTTLYLICCIAAILTSCKSDPEISTLKTVEVKVSPSDKSFDSCMVIYAKGNLSMQNLPSLYHSYHESYKISSRYYFPGFYNLTFDSRSFRKGSHETAADICHIYNDSIQFILPFTDMYFLRQKAFNDSIDVKPYLTLGKELNDLMKLLNIGDNVTIDQFLGEIMHIKGCDRINTAFQVSIFKLQARHFQEVGTYSPPCSSDIDKIINRVEGEYKDENKYIYTNGGTLVYIFTFSGTVISSAEILGLSCIF